MYLQADRDAGSLGKGFCVVSALSWVAAAGLGDQRVLGGAGVWGHPGAEGELTSRGAHSSVPGRRLSVVCARSLSRFSSFERNCPLPP